MRYIICFIISFLIGFVGAACFLKRPMVSVVMGTYNRAELLPRAVDSILSQTYKDFEFIIIVDGSTDETADILKNYALKDNRIRILNNDKNKGLVYSLNRGLDAARGKYIARMDDDDISLPDRLAYQVDFMENNPDITVISSWISPIGSMQPYPFQKETDPEKIEISSYLDTVPISHPASFIRHDFIKQHHIKYRDSYTAAEDRPFWRDIIDAGGIISNVPKVLLQYRLHGENSREYYMHQYKGRNVFNRDMWSRLIGEEADAEISKCEKFVKMAAANKEKKLLNQEKMEELIKEKCPDVEF